MIGTRLTITYKNVHSGETTTPTSFPSLLVGYNRMYLTPPNFHVTIQGDSSKTLWELAEDWLSEQYPDAKLISGFYVTDTLPTTDPFIGYVEDSGWTQLDPNDTTATQSTTTYYFALEAEHNVEGTTYSYEIDAVIPKSGSTIPWQKTFQLSELAHYYTLTGNPAVVSIMTAADTPADASSDATTNIITLDPDQHSYKVTIKPSASNTSASDTAVKITINFPIIFKPYVEPMQLDASEWDALLGPAHPFNQIRFGLELYSRNAGTDVLPYVGLVAPDVNAQDGMYYDLNTTNSTGTTVGQILSAAQDLDVFVVSVLGNEFTVGGEVKSYVREAIEDYHRPVIAMMGYSSFDKFANAYSSIVDLTQTTRGLISKSIAKALTTVARSYHSEYIRVVFPATIFSNVLGSPYDNLPLPGYFYTAAYAGSISNAGTALNRISEPYTNKILAGINGASYEKVLYTLTPSDKESVEDSGIWLLENNGKARHQVTTNTDSIEQREDSIVRTALWLAKLIGKVAEQIVYGEDGKVKNITPDLLSELKTQLSIITQRIIDIVVAIGTQVIDVSQDKDVPDQINITFAYKPLYPADIINIQVII